MIYEPIVPLKLESIKVEIRSVDDIVAVRRRAREFASSMGFGLADQTRLATAVSELARNILQYAGSGYSEIHDQSIRDQQILLVRMIDEGPGIASIDFALTEGCSTSNGLGIGLSGCRRLMDAFVIESELGKGTMVQVELHANR